MLLLQLPEVDLDQIQSCAASQVYYNFVQFLLHFVFDSCQKICLPVKFELCIIQAKLVSHPI